MIDFYKSHKNNFLKEAKNLVPRIIRYNDNAAFALVDKRNKNHYYCFLSTYGIRDIERVCEVDVVSKLSLTDYFNFSERLVHLKFKLNFRKIIYDSNRNK